MLELTKGIFAKQELIGKLERSQLKYEVSRWNISHFANSRLWILHKIVQTHHYNSSKKMKSFYHDKLKKMTMQLSIQEAEKVKLEAVF